MGKRVSCVISGSFRKFYEGIASAANEFAESGMEVLSPTISRIINPESGFVILETDDTDDIEELEMGHLNAIKKADFLYIYNPGGYIGKSVTLELGWALALDKPIYSLEKPDDIVLERLTEVKSIGEICKVYRDLSS